MELDDALTLARATRQSVLTTIRRNGRPQLSNVLHAVADDGRIRISSTASRAKVANLRREPWAAMHVDGPSFFSYAVIEGEASVTATAADPHDATVEELVDLYRSLAGEHEDWDDYRRAMVDEGRVVVTITPARAYGVRPDTLPGL